MTPLVSVIIPVYNGEKTIKLAVESCLDQSLKNIEIIVVDNGSTDGTQGILQKIEDERVNYIRIEQKGRSLARNLGLKKATGAYIQFLDADDWLLPKKLELATNYLEKHSEVKAYVCGIDYKAKEGRVKRLFPKYTYEHEILAHNIFPIHSVVFRKEEPVYFDEMLDYCEDWLFWVDELYGKELYFDTQEIGGVVCIHDDNTMKQVDKMNEYQLYVQQLLKVRFGKKTKQLRLNEIKLLVVHYYTQEKEQLTVDIVKKNSSVLYRLLACICSLPIISKIGQKKMNNLSDHNLY